ncbi:C40 family peptidase [Streptomyces sp. NPDC058745]|uniref:C40 family peptidase n=1 Tax=Streptomyces sp. NPDC058745 TaxID=3346621 RepID=UPI0036852F0C
MSGRLLRTVCTGMLAATTALTGALTGVGPATADPGDPSVEAATDGPTPPSDPSGPAGRADPTGQADPSLSSGPAPDGATGGGAGSTSDAAELAPSGGDSVTTLLTRLQTLYRQAEQATESFNATDEALKTQTADTRKITAGLTAARRALTQGRDAAGRMAREQYQGHSELSSYLELLLARDPQHALDQRHLLTRAARDRASALARLEDAEKKADALASASRRALDRQQTLAARQRKQRDDVRTRLAEVERLLATLSADQLARLAERERTQTAGAQRDLLDSGVLDGTRTPSAEGGAALDFAVRQIGKPYSWGAEGPDAYDCSGLTSQAWASAGREIPRTSQEQWRTLPKVELSELRPGDLVVYFPEATHVAIYLGGGLVVQAPRPGARVKVSPIAANPLLGAVRPDPSGVPLPSFTPPDLPAGARDGSDEGFDAGLDAAPDPATGTATGTGAGPG